MLKDIRVHGAVTESIDFYATLAGEKLLSAPFYEVKETSSGREISLFLAGMYFRFDHEGLSFSGTGGSVSEYMFGSPMPLQDLGLKEVKNRLVFFGTFPGEEGLTFTSKVYGFQSYDSLFLDGNALSNSFFLIKVPWPYSSRRTQEVLLKTLGHVLKRSENPGKGDDSALQGEILRELAEPEATLLLLRLVHRPNEKFYQFVQHYYGRCREWGEAQERFVAPLALEIGIQQYQRRRIAVDILYKDENNRQVVDEYKDVLFKLMMAEETPSTAVARLNTLRNLAMRHGLPPNLFDTLDGLIPASTSVQDSAPEFLRRTREIFEGLFLSSKSASEAFDKREIVQLLTYKQEAQKQRDNGFEQILLETGRILDERAAQGGDLEPFEIFSEIVTYFDRLDNAEAVVNQLAFMEHATVTEDKIRSILGNKRALDSIEEGLFKHLLLDPVLENPYILGVGRRKVRTLYEGLVALEQGQKTLADIAAELDRLALNESAEQRLYEGIGSRLKQFYFNLSNPAHVRLLKRDVEGEIAKDPDWSGGVPEGAFDAALRRVQWESEYTNNILPRQIEGGDPAAKTRFLEQSGLDLFRLEELEREYREAHGLKLPEGEGTQGTPSLP